MTPRVKFEEGEWFALPLRVDGWGVGVIARTSVPYRMVHLLGYFFGPARPAIPTLEDVVGLRAEDALLFGFFSGRPLSDELWPMIGRDPAWDRERWPILPMGGYALLTPGGPFVRRTYHEGLAAYDEVPIGGKQWEMHPSGSWHLGRSIEGALTRRILNPEAPLNSPPRPLPPELRHFSIKNGRRVNLWRATETRAKRPDLIVSVHRHHEE